MQRLFVLLILGVVGSFGVASADESVVAEKPFGITKREPWTTSNVVGTPEPPPPYTVKRIYPEIKFNGPVFIAQEPGTDRIIVAEVSGKIYSFSKSNPTAESKKLFLDVKRQIYAFSFHTNYEENGQIFVFSPTGPHTRPKDTPKEGKDKKENPSGDSTETKKDTAKPKKGADKVGSVEAPKPERPKQSRIFRYQTTLKHPRVGLPESEEIIIEWLAGGHNGGEAIMGPDGYLYIATGDSTGGSDPKATGQGVDDLFSVIMRIDVDHPEGDKAYSIPKDNPFVDYPGARPEIWAHGFRNPWRMSFDKEGR